MARDTGTGTCVVRIEADRSGERRTVAAEGTVVAGASAAGVVVAALVATPLLLVVTPVAVLAGIGVAASGRSQAGTVEREVERLVDAVDQHVDPVRLRVDVARRVTGRVKLTTRDRALPGGGG
jgi:Flp pilus assembly protein TadB